MRKVEGKGLVEYLNNGVRLHNDKSISGLGCRLAHQLHLLLLYRARITPLKC